MRAVSWLMVLAAPLAAGKITKRGYDPLRVEASERVLVRDVTCTDGARKRDILLRVYLDPEVGAPRPVVLFSHGLGGSRENNGYLGRHWAARGYVVVAMQHAGSDEAVWKGVSGARRLAAMKEAANRENAIARFAEVTAVLDQLQVWQDEEGHLLEGRLDLSRVGMSGHSFGAVTTQGVSGERVPGGGTKYTDDRIDAALAMSPSAPSAGSSERAFGMVGVPWMLMTGTDDRSMVGRTSVEDRRKVYPALPPGGKYELVLKDARHMAFSDRTLRGREHRNPNHHKVIVALSTAFWDAHLKELSSAKAWLEGEGAGGLLEEGDRWQWK